MQAHSNMQLLDHKKITHQLLRSTEQRDHGACCRADFALSGRMFNCYTATAEVYALILTGWFSYFLEERSREVPCKRPRVQRVMILAVVIFSFSVYVFYQGMEMAEGPCGYLGEGLLLCKTLQRERPSTRLNPNMS